MCNAEGRRVSVAQPGIGQGTIETGLPTRAIRGIASDCRGSALRSRRADWPRGRGAAAGGSCPPRRVRPAGRSRPMCRSPRPTQGRRSTPQTHTSPGGAIALPASAGSQGPRLARLRRRLTGAREDPATGEADPPDRFLPPSFRSWPPRPAVLDSQSQLLQREPSRSSPSRVVITGRCCCSRGRFEVEARGPLLLRSIDARGSILMVRGLNVR